MGMKNDEPKRPPKSILYYYGIILVVLLLLNVLIFPSLTERKVTEVTYDQFLDMLDEGLVKGVNRTDDQITFWTEPELPADSAQGEGTMFELIEQMQMRAENVQLFKTGAWPDPDLLDRLREKNVTFTEPIPTKASPLQNIFFNWILPFVMLLVIGQVFLSLIHI